MLKMYLKVMKALSDRSRVKIIKMLQDRELCVCELQAALGLTQPAVSKQLRLLEDAGLVESRRVGPWMNYRLPETTDSAYADHLLNVLREWLNEDSEIKIIVQQAKTLDRCEITSRCRQQ